MDQQLFSRHNILIVCILMLGIGLTSCGGLRKAQQKQLLYLQGKLDTLPNIQLYEKEITIQKGDILSITVYSDNPEATAIFNQRSSSSAGGNQPNQPNSGGYVIDQKGNLHFHTFGNIHVEGLTKQELMDVLKTQLSVYLKNPYLDIRFLNLRFTVIGEVVKPGTFTIPQERISILEMLGLAGDLTVYGRRDNILVIREINGRREFGRIDLRKADIFQSPYFYLQQNDVVVVEPNPKKPTVNDQVATRNLTIATGIASLLSTIVILVNVFK